MKPKTYDINFLIVAVILFLLAACFGCEKEPEHYHSSDCRWPVNTDWEIAEPCDFQPTPYYIVIWPGVFIDPNYEYPDENQYELAVADGLEGWGLSFAGNEKPENFGMGMVKIGNIIGESALPENLMRLSDEIVGE